MWKPGDRLTHRHNPELGLGEVVAIEGRAVIVKFLNSDATLRLAVTSDALQPIDLAPGRRVRVGSNGPEAVVDAHLQNGEIRLVDGRTVGATELWPVEDEASLLERLALGEIDSVEDFSRRLDVLRLAELREADGLGSFLGGRIRLFPHQLHVAERATAADPVRWLLADEVGLGKTVEACLILNRLIRTSRVERCLIVAPDTLVVQWLGELWRKYHQVFLLLDDERLDDIARELGPGFNPFEAHRRVVLSIERLIAQPRLTEQAAAAGIDLLVVDEAHHLKRPPGHPGNQEWRAIAPIAALDRHTLLLTATPFEDDVHGFFRLLQLLRPDEFSEDEDFAARLGRNEPLPPCTSATRRVDIGGLPPRVGLPVPLDAEAWQPRTRLEASIRSQTAAHAVARRRQLERFRRLQSSGAALLGLLDSGDEDARRLAADCDERDPRLAWVLEQAPHWKRRGEKSLVFVADRETLEWLRTSLSRRGQIATAVFHEELSPARRDIEVARFRGFQGPSLLVSTECGGEGRNFEFCDRIVLFDLPWSPVVVEQRIGRLDRIGRTTDVAIVYFQPADGLGALVARLFERLGLFREPLAGLEPELQGVEGALEAAALGSSELRSVAAMGSIVEEVDLARSRVREAAYRELHRNRYRPELAEGILARVPEQLDALNRKVVLDACGRLGFGIEPQRDAVFSIDFGNEALVDSLPGVQGGSSFVGTFERARAVEDEGHDYFAAGHPLVEGLLAHLDEQPTGRVAAFSVDVGAGAERSLGLLVIYEEGRTLEVVAIDARGRRRPHWAAAIREGSANLAPLPEAALRDPGWAATIRQMAAALGDDRQPAAVAALVVEPEDRR